jgi:hypothetical protein
MCFKEVSKVRWKCGSGNVSINKFTNSRILPKNESSIFSSLIKLEAAVMVCDDEVRQLVNYTSTEDIQVDR